LLEYISKTHSFERLGAGSRVRVTVDTTGPLAFLWIASSPASWPRPVEQTRRFAQFARAR
jgi:hypothetical protein